MKRTVGYIHTMDEKPATRDGKGGYLGTCTIVTVVPSLKQLYKEQSEDRALREKKGYRSFRYGYIRVVEANQ